MKLSSELLAGAEIDPRWTNGPFLGIKLMPAKAKGKRFEQIAQAVFIAYGHTVTKPQNSDHDRIVNGEKFEMKGSTITKNTDDVFSFLQIRPAQDYDALILQTFWFDGTIKYYKIPKSDIQMLISNKTFKKQHGGNKAESGTFCYNGNMKPFENYFWFSVQITK
jgi:hypothetical protein